MLIDDLKTFVDTDALNESLDAFIAPSRTETQ